MKPGKQTLAERARELMEEIKDINLVSSIMNIPVEKIDELLKVHHHNPYLLYPLDSVIALFKAGNSITQLHHKTGHSVRNIIVDLQNAGLYKTFDELHGKIKYSDLEKQAAFIAERDRLLAHYYKEGWNIYGLALEFGLKGPFVVEVLKQAGFNFHEKLFYAQLSPFFKQRLYESIYTDYQNGKSIPELASKYGRSERSIWGIISFVAKSERL